MLERTDGGRIAVADRWLTFDCYGTVADWNSGMGGALTGLAGVSAADAGRRLAAGVLDEWGRGPVRHHQGPAAGAGRRVGDGRRGAQLQAGPRALPAVRRQDRGDSGQLDSRSEQLGPRHLACGPDGAALGI